MKKIRFLIKLIRGAEWWEYKLAVLAAIGYATVLVWHISLADAAKSILFYVLATAVSFSYVSLVNDFTDLEEDLAVGKKTGMAALSPAMRWLSLSLCTVIGVVIGFFMWPNVLSLVFYTGTWVVFTLYSVPPFRWKAKGILGVLCDATGVHVFPSLLMVSGVSHALGIAVDNYWYFLIATWSSAFGLRGILWHQVLDRKNDIETKTRTFATRIPVQYLKPIAVFLFVVEISCFVGVLIRIGHSSGWIALLLYVILVVIRYARYSNIPIIMITPENKSSQVLMLDYYQAFLPISLLIISSLEYPWVWLVLLAHVLLFPATILVVLKDYGMAIDALYRQIRYSS